MAGRISPEFIDQLLARADLVEVIERRVPLVQKGKEYQARCPFHEEKTPSFTVSPAKQFYHCFGCGAHGNAIGFLMQYANLGYVEAIEEIAAQIGLEVPRANAYNAAKIKTARPIYEVLATAAKWFQRQLRTDAAQPAVAYLKNRGVEGATAAEFGIGYAPPGWDNLARALARDAAAKRSLVQAGLLARRENKSSSGDDHIAEPGAGGGANDFDAGGVYDRFRHRIIFPIHDRRGQVVGFGGRALGDDPAKYLNSPETPAFKKGVELYGFTQARRAIGAHKKSLVVEGYMDVISLAQHGVRNAVATLGTATTRAHLQRLFQAAPEIIFCFDGDRAGREAAWKALQVALPEMHDGRLLGFLFLPDGEDPDSYIRAHGKDKFLAQFSQAKSFPQFLFENLSAGMDDEQIDMKARLNELAKPLLAQLPDGEMLDALCDKFGFAKRPLTAVAPAKAAINAGAARAQTSPLDQAVSLLLQNPQLAATVADPESIARLDDGAILGRLLEKITADPTVSTARLLELFRDDTQTYARLQELATRNNFIVDATAQQQQFQDTLKSLFAAQARRRRENLVEQLRVETDPARKRQLTQDMHELLKTRAPNNAAAPPAA